MTDVATVAIEGGRNVGRYFSAISLIPSLLFILYVVSLVLAGAWSGPFVPERAFRAMTHPTIEGIGSLLLAAVALGIVIHPFQFSITQLLEGYWGAGIWLGAAQRRVLHHRREVRRLEDEADVAYAKWVSVVERNRATPGELAVESRDLRRQLNLFYLDAEVGDPMIGSYLRADAHRAARDEYPEAGRRILPTRLGNVLRRYEDAAGRQYGLDILQLAPHLNLVAVKEHREYVEDARKGLDLTVRVCALSALAAVVSIVVLLDDGAWVLLALAPYAASYLAYRGAVASAHSYGTALSTLVDLNRFALYEQVGLRRPTDTLFEKEQNARLMKLLANESSHFLVYAPASKGP